MIDLKENYQLCSIDFLLRKSDQGESEKQSRRKYKWNASSSITQTID